uniref:Uncharacterized protein n=1 Tax=Anopheles atroparvus TaxID=41427 RepID=A0A182IZX5_ANOAO
MTFYQTEARRSYARMIAFWFILILVIRTGNAADSICERIDFNDINTWKVQQCSGAFRESFRLSSYATSQTFRPFRDRTTYFLSNDVRGISCTESINSFYMNSFTEIRMIYQLMFYNPCSLTLMVYDLDLMDVFGQPLLAQNWTTRAQTSTWSLFVGKVEREIRRARILLQADMSADGQLAIEYITVFNPLVLEEFCMVLDEFYTTTELNTTDNNNLYNPYHNYNDNSYHYNYYNNTNNTNNNYNDNSYDYDNNHDNSYHHHDHSNDHNDNSYNNYNDNSYDHHDNSYNDHNNFDDH